MDAFTDCPVRSYRRHTVLAIVFAPLVKAMVFLLTLVYVYLYCNR